MSRMNIESDGKDRFYVNCSIVNTTNDPIQCNFDRVYQQAILSNPQDYYFTLNRFSISASGIPLMILEIQSGVDQNDTNLTNLLFTLSYDNQNYQGYVEYVPNNDMPNPVAPGYNSINNYNQSTSEYYFVFSIQQFLTMLNNTLSTLFNDLIVANPLAPQTLPPYYIFNPPTQLISLITPYNYLDVLHPIQISVNAALYRYLNGFEYFINDTDLNGMDYSYILADNNNNWFAIQSATITNPPAYLQFQQEYIQNYLMSSLQSIVITTNTIPLQSEIIPLPVSTVGNPFDNNSMSIITDFIVPLNQIGDARSLIVYTPATLRMINFVSDNPIKRLDFQVYFQDSLGNLYPLNILPYTSASFKFGFFKRATYLN